MADEMIKPVVAIDPGTDKCGFAVVSKSCILRRWIAPRIQLIEELAKAVEAFEIETIVLGDRTGSKAFRSEIAAAFPSLKIAVVDEHMSSMEARARYWVENPPRGWRKVLPVGMQVPPQPYDDLVAVILAERYFEQGTQ